MNVGVLAKSDASSIEADVLLPNGKIKLLPSTYWQGLDWTTFRYFCHIHARYGIVTEDLITFLKSTQVPDGAKVLEIGAGSGDLGYHLSVKMTDSHQQTRSDIKRRMAQMGQPVIQYGEDVEKMDALEAVKLYKPDIVIASWVTPFHHIVTPKFGSNPWGVKESLILPLVDKFIHIGNSAIHGDKPIRDIEHDVFQPDWLVSRAQDQKKNVIYVWSKNIK